MRPHLATIFDDFRRNGRQIAVVTHRGNRRLPSTWAELAELSARFAAELDGRGIGMGDRVLIWGGNSVEWIAAFFGCILRGVVAVPLDPGSSTDFARKVANEVQPRLAAGNLELLRRLDGGSSTSMLAFSSFSRELPDPNYTPVPGLSRETVLQIVFTSGTTSEPKGIVHTHGNVLASLDPLEEEIGKYLRYERFVHPLRLLHTLPLSHVFGQFMGLWVPPLIPLEVHYELRLEASRVIGIIDKDRVSVLAAVPRVLDLLRGLLTAEMPELTQMLAAARGQPLWKRWWRFRRLHRRFGLKFWALVCGGAAVSPEMESFWTTAGFALIQGYGMTETTALVTLNNPFKPTHGSIGRPLRGREVEIGPEGEILVRGASVADRVWRNGQMEQRPEGWLATGDLVTRDERGELVFSGRKSDVIVTSAGVNIHPEDLEKALRKQPGVRDALVVPYLSPAGPVPAAVLMAQEPPAHLDAETAVAAANRELSASQQILYSLVWPQADFPRTTTGKIIRRQVENWASQSLNGQGAEPGAAGLVDPLIDLLHQLQPASRNEEISAQSRLAEDLHLDSLAMVQLASALETKFGVEVDDSVWQQTRTVGDLRRLLGSAEMPPVELAPAAAGRESTPAQAQTAPVQEREPVRPVSRAPSAPMRTKPVFPRWPWRPPVQIVRVGFMELAVRPLVRVLLAPKVSRTPLHRPSLIIANHVTAMDAAILLYGLRARDRDHVAIAMSGEILAGWRAGKAQKHRIAALLTPLAYWLVTALFNAFPLPRGSGLRQSFALAGEALDRGYHVLVFPEGRRSPDGRLQPFESGIGLLAQESQVPVQPIYISGLGPLKLRQKSWFRSGTVTVRIGEPLAMKAGEDPAQFAQRLHAAMEKISGSASQRNLRDPITPGVGHRPR